MAKQRTYKRVRLKEAAYYYYDIPMNQYLPSSSKRLYADTPDALEKKIQAAENELDKLRVDAVEAASSFSELCDLYMYEHIPDMQREIITRHCAVASALLPEGMPTQEQWLSFFLQLAPGRSKKALSDFNDVFNEISSYGMKYGYRGHYPYARIKLFISEYSTPENYTYPYSLSDYTAVLEELQRKKVSGEYKYGSSVLFIPFSVEVCLAADELVRVTWNDLRLTPSGADICVRALKKHHDVVQGENIFHLNDNILSLLCSFTSERYHRKIDIAALGTLPPEAEIIPTFSDHSLFNRHLSRILRRCALPDNTSLIPFALQIRKAMKSSAP